MTSPSDRYRADDGPPILRPGYRLSPRLTRQPASRTQPHNRQVHSLNGLEREDQPRSAFVAEKDDVVNAAK